MKLCFVAKDEEEFVRYLNGQLQIPGVKSLHTGFRKDSRILRILARHDIYKYEKRKCNTGWFSICIVDDLPQNLQVYVMLADDNLKEFICKNLGVLEDAEVCAKSKMFLQAIESCMQSNDKVDGQNKESFDDDTIVFIHWGGRDPSWCEEHFQPFCDKHRETAKGLRTFALSSRRTELFNVTASTIVLPKTEEEARELADSFLFVRIKGLMNAYLVTYFSNLKEEQECTGQSFPITDKRLLWPLQSFFNNQKNRLEMHDPLSDIDKRRLETLRNLVGLDWEKVTQLPYEEETAELFAALIRSKGRV